MVFKIRLSVAAVLMSGLCAACGGGSLSSGDFGTSLGMPDAQVAATEPVEEYRISPLDKLSISVFPAKDFTIQSTRVDANGQFVLPPLGAIPAQGKTPTELSRELEAKLSACCLQKPQVIVLVEETNSRQITVTGAVMASDVYNLRGPTTLLQAITMAKGPDRATANLKQVVIYRVTNGQRMGARFNVEEIQAGRAPDPQVYGGDVIIVDSSATKNAWRNVIQAVPFFGVFAAF